MGQDILQSYVTLLGYEALGSGATCQVLGYEALGSGATCQVLGYEALGSGAICQVLGYEVFVRQMVSTY